MSETRASCSGRPSSSRDPFGWARVSTPRWWARSGAPTVPTQLSYGGHPLYTYNLDVTPGMVTGQGFDQDGGLWYVVGAKGQQITTPFSVNSPNQNGNG